MVKLRFRKQFKNTMSIIKDIVLAASIIIVYWQYKQADKHEKTKNTFELVSKVYNNEFLMSYKKIKYCDTINNAELNDARNLVLNTYNFIAIMYNDNKVDQELIAKLIGDGVEDFMELDFNKNDSTNHSVKEINKMIQTIKKNKP